MYLGVTGPRALDLAVLGRAAVPAKADGAIVYVSDVTSAVAPQVNAVPIPDAVNVLASTKDDTSRMFGARSEVDPIDHSGAVLPLPGVKSQPRYVPPPDTSATSSPEHGVLPSGFTTTIEGTGNVALISRGNLIALEVTPNTPLFVDPDAFIGYKGQVQQEFVFDVNWRTMVGEASGESYQFKFTGQGVVFIQPAER